MNTIFVYVWRVLRKIRLFFSGTPAVPPEKSVPVTQEYLEERLQAMYKALSENMRSSTEHITKDTTESFMKLIEFLNSSVSSPELTKNVITGFQPNAILKKEKKEQKSRGVEA